jgi:ABC-type multidrug transport system permease subunit
MEVSMTSSWWLEPADRAGSGGFFSEFGLLLIVAVVIIVILLNKLRNKE